MTALKHGHCLASVTPVLGQIWVPKKVLTGDKHRLFCRSCWCKQDEDMQAIAAAQQPNGITIRPLPVILPAGLTVAAIPSQLLLQSGAAQLPHGQGHTGCALAGLPSQDDQ